MKGGIDYQRELMFHEPSISDVQYHTGCLGVDRFSKIGVKSNSTITHDEDAMGLIDLVVQTLINSHSGLDGYVMATTLFIDPSKCAMLSCNRVCIYSDRFDSNMPIRPSNRIEIETLTLGEG